MLWSGATEAVAMKGIEDPHWIVRYSTVEKSSGMTKAVARKALDDENSNVRDAARSYLGLH